MGVFHFFQVVQMVPNCAKHHKWNVLIECFIFIILLLIFILNWLKKVPLPALQSNLNLNLEQSFILLWRNMLQCVLVCTVNDVSKKKVWRIYSR